MNHEIKFFTNERTGLAAAQCSCGWYVSGTIEAVEAHSYGHAGQPKRGGKSNGKVEDTE